MREKQEDRNLTSFCKTSRQQLFLPSILLMHEVDNWFLLLGPLQSWRAIFGENRNMQLSKQVELGGCGFTSLFSYLQDSLPQQTAVPQHSTWSVPLVRRAELRPFQPPAWIRATAKLKSSLCLLMTAIHQKNKNKQKKTKPVNCLKFWSPNIQDTHET